MAHRFHGRYVSNILHSPSSDMHILCIILTYLSWLVVSVMRADLTLLALAPAFAAQSHPAPAPALVPVPDQVPVHLADSY